MRKCFHSLLYSILVLLLVSCDKQKPDSPLAPEEAPVLFSLDTKSLGVGEKTFRVALLDIISGAFSAQGTYCSDIIHHESTLGENGWWISPCRVDNDGLPLKSDGTEAVGLSQADKDSKYGLRGGQGSYSLVVASPAKAFTNDGSLRYYPWTPSSELYVSNSVSVNLSGSWLDGEYVYTSSDRTALTLKDRRASLYVHIECGELSTAYIQRVTLVNCITEARWYLKTGFSANESHYDTDDIPLFDYSTDGGIKTLTKVPKVDWTSSVNVFLPSIDYSNADFASMRPRIVVLMGNDPAHPSTAVIDITETMDPMKNYTYNLFVSKSDVVLTLTCEDWDSLPGGDINSDDSEDSAVIGTIALNGWTEDSAQNTDDWNNHF